MTYAEALAYLHQFTNYEALPPGALASDAPQLERMRRVLGWLGNPQLGWLTIHVAGTKGKGSVAAMLASVLGAAGYHTGLYTSPELCEFRERIRINGAPVSEAAFAQAVDKLAPAEQRYHAGPKWGRLTFYELVTLTAWLCFREARVTAQVLEVGLGGRLDATNVLEHPDLCIITPVSFDHMEVLGATLEAIAAEKAGIIKAGSPVLMGPQPPEARAVINARGAALDTLVLDVAREYSWRRVEGDLTGQWMTVSSPLGEWDLRLPLLGGAQLDNAATVVAAAEVLIERGFPLAPRHVVQGIEDVVWAGRLQVVEREPLLVLDGAHNDSSARWLASAVRYELPHQRAILVVGQMRDKDTEVFAAELAPVTDLVLTVQGVTPRAATADDLAQVWQRHGVAARAAGDVAAGLAAARAEAGPGDLILVTGSLAVVGEALRALGRAGDAAYASGQARRDAGLQPVFSSTDSPAP